MGSQDGEGMDHEYRVGPMKKSEVSSWPSPQISWSSLRQRIAQHIPTGALGVTRT